MHALQGVYICMFVFVNLSVWVLEMSFSELLKIYRTLDIALGLPDTAAYQSKVSKIVTYIQQEAMRSRYCV